jgi:hypothetical protein
MSCIPRPAVAGAIAPTATDAEVDLDCAGLFEPECALERFALLDWLLLSPVIMI